MGFSEQVVQAVWNRGRIVSGYDPSEFRQDECTAWMRRSAYGERSSVLGWEIDHIKPVSEGGTDVIWNLRPLQWENNAERSSGPLTCLIRSQGTKNVRALSLLAQILAERSGSRRF